VTAGPGVSWEQPGPGSWTFDGAHNFGPVTPIVQEVFPSAMADGFRSFTGRYGLPISHIEVAYVNGYAFSAVRVAGVPVSDRPPPPAPVLRVISRLVPELRRRNRAALEALRTRPWRADLDRWFTELRPARLRALRSMQTVDPARLTDDELADHVTACVDGLRSGLREHFGLVGAAGLPVGVYLRRETARGRTVAHALDDLRGAASGSTAATVPALAAIAKALADAGVTDPSSLSDVHHASPQAATTLDTYLGEYGQRVVGAFDVTGKRLIETPEIIVRSIAAAAGRPEVAPLPASDDTVVEDARLAIASRDDHAGVCCTWPLGLLRRALLEAGERLAADDRLVTAELVFEAGSAEIVALLRRGDAAPSSTALAERAAARRRAADVAPPPTLGPIHAPPQPSAFPAGLRAISAAMDEFLTALETVRAHDGVGRGIGVGVGTEPYRGRAVVAADPEDAIARLAPGDVLVTPTTTPAYNTVLVLAGAIVTAHGGPMSHAGIISRELGIPAVLGLGDALDLIPDGAEVEVDPLGATVRIIARRT
jgi:pyruvate,water dikinase